MSKANKRERQRENREMRREYEGKLQRRRRFTKSARTFALLVAPVLIILVIINITNSSDDKEAAAGSNCTEVKVPAATDTTLPAPELTLDANQNYTATVATTCGVIDIDLAAATNPTSVNNFVYLTNEKFFDNLAIVRAAKNFVIQTGSPTQTNSGGPGYSVTAEVPTTEPYYPRGTVAWAKSSSEPAGSAGSQFFIVTGTASLPPDYAVIGKVSKGLNVARAIEKFAPDSGDGPLTRAVVMKKVTITTKGIIPPITVP